MNIQLSSVEQPANELLIVGHTYQPPRDFHLVSQTERGAQAGRASMISWINQEIYEACYRPIFVESPRLPDGTLFSLFGSLREWIIAHHPGDFAKIRQNINNTPDPEYHVLGDPWLHPIMPLQSEGNQEMLAQIGLTAFEQDLGFRPKGFWLPEAAVSSQTLRALHHNGIEFVVLRSDQIEEAYHNPMYVVFEDVDQHGQRVYKEMAVFHFDMGLSGDVSFNDHRTANADVFLRAFSGSAGQTIAIGSDTELYGWHKQFRDQFLAWVTSPEVQARNGFKAVDVKQRLLDKNHRYTRLREYSSWSCEHNLHRWTGECGCEGRTPDVAWDIRQLFEALVDTGAQLDGTLDQIRPQWRQEFVPFFLAVREEMFIAGNMQKRIERLVPRGFDLFGTTDLRPEKGRSMRNNYRVPAVSDPTIRTLFLAQLARFTAATSCYGFYNHKDAPERVLVSINIAEINELLQKLYAPAVAGRFSLTL